jgi:hypothetical protein
MIDWLGVVLSIASRPGGDVGTMQWTLMLVSHTILTVTMCTLVTWLISKNIMQPAPVQPVPQPPPPPAPTAPVPPAAPPSPRVIVHLAYWSMDDGIGWTHGGHVPDCTDVIEHDMNCRGTNAYVYKATCRRCGIRVKQRKRYVL